MVTWSTVMPVRRAAPRRRGMTARSADPSAPPGRSHRMGSRSRRRQTARWLGGVDEGSCDSLPAQGSLAAGATVLLGVLLLFLSDAFSEGRPFASYSASPLSPAHPGLRAPPWFPRGLTSAYRQRP